MESPSARRRDRIEGMIGVGLLLVSLVIIVVYLLSQSSTPEVLPTSTPAATLTPSPESAVRFETLAFTSRVAYGDTLNVQVFTDAGTRCQISVSVFSVALGNYENIQLADYTVDSSGICAANLPIDAQYRVGEHTLRITLRKGAQSRLARWTFEILPPD